MHTHYRHIQLNGVTFQIFPLNEVLNDLFDKRRWWFKTLCLVINLKKTSCASWKMSVTVENKFVWFADIFWTLSWYANTYSRWLRIPAAFVLLHQRPADCVTLSCASSWSEQQTHPVWHINQKQISIATLEGCFKPSML